VKNEGKGGKEWFSAARTQREKRRRNARVRKKHAPEPLTEKKKKDKGENTPAHYGIIEER